MTEDRIIEQAKENAKIVEKSNEVIKLYNESSEVESVDSNIVFVIQDMILDIFGSEGVLIKSADGPIIVLDEEKKVLELKTKILCEIFDVEDIDMKSIREAISDFINKDVSRYNKPITYIQHILVVRNERNMDYQTGEPIENPKPSIEVMIKMAYDQEAK